MNQISNINATLVKEVFYDATINPGATTVNFTVENCSVNAFIQQIVFTLAGPQSNFASGLTVTIKDRGHSYPGSINGFNPITFAVIGTSPTIYPQNQSIPSLIVQNGNVVTVDVLQSVEDAEGIGNIYVQVNNSNGFTQSFTMSVIYRPEITYNTKLNTRNQISNDKPFRVLSQIGVATYADPTAVMTDQTNMVYHSVNPRNNTDTLTNGFQVTNANPYFYFGTPFQTKRWFLGFSSDNSKNIGIISFNYFNGAGFTSFSTSYNGALGASTNGFCNDGVVIFSPPSNWVNLQMANDPYTIYNNTIIGLGTRATNNLVPNPLMYWVQVYVGFNGVGTLQVSSVVPLIDPALPITYRRRII